MKIWIDICHIPQYNFFRPLILQLTEKGNDVVVTVMERGRTLKIVRHEMEDVPHLTIVPMGKHKMTKWSALWDANLMRMLRLLFWLPRQHFDVALSTNIFTSLFGQLYGIRNYSFGDDPQVYDLKYNCRWATKAHQCIYEWTLDKPMPQGLNILRCTKEWAYLNPRTFKPNVKVLEKYGLQPKQYLFLREVSVGTVNYAAQSPQAILSISPLIQQFTQWCQAPMCNSSSSDPTITQKGQTPLCNIQENSPVCTEGQSPCANFKVLFSLEEKHRRSEYPADWILLQEPIEDIHSLMYYAAGLVSSGDSMAREAALLGIPAYYLGVRHSMPANLAASKVANLQNETTQPFEAWLRDLAQPKYLLEDKTVDKIGVKIEGEIKATSLSPEQQSAKRVEYLSKQQDSLRQKIDSDFIDINAYMLSLVEGEKELNR